MSVQARPARKKYRISNEWLRRHYNDNGAYVDLDEIVLESSSYVAEEGLDPKQEARKANFVRDGILVGETTKGNQVVLLLTDEPPGDQAEWRLAEGIVHPLSVKRIYARTLRTLHTECEDIVIMGYGQHGFTG